MLLLVSIVIETIVSNTELTMLSLTSPSVETRLLFGIVVILSPPFTAFQVWMQYFHGIYYFRNGKIHTRILKKMIHLDCYLGVSLGILGMFSKIHVNLTLRLLQHRV